jgi:hypothetical protein
MYSEPSVEYRAISLGYNCSAASIGVHSGVRKTKEQGYKTCPFDLMNTNYDGLIECLRDDFKYFYDLQYLIIKQFPIDHPYYPGENIICNTKYGFIFNHESPGHADLYNIEKWEGGITHFIDNTYQKFIERYKQRIENFRNYIHSGSPIMFLITSIEQNFDEIYKLFKNQKVSILRYDITNYNSYNEHMNIMNELKSLSIRHIVKTLVLIISDDSNDTYKKNRDVWRLYMKINPNFDCFFLTAKSDIIEPYIENDTLYVPGIESLIPGIIEKTIQAIYFFKDSNYDYILRTNLSSVFNFNSLENILISSPRENFYFGVDIGGGAGSGAGIIMSKDVYTLLLNTNQYTDLFKYGNDDENIGIIMRHNKIPLTVATRIDIEKDIHNYEQNAYHYRCKQLNSRFNEASIMKTLVNKIYYNYISGEKIQELCDVYLGENDKFTVNPYIQHDKHKWKSLSSITKAYSNPKLVFCYPDYFDDFINKVNLFVNPFILISHNSDYTITDKHINLLNNPKLIHWFGQNATISHSKLTPIPIGIANQMFEHGKIENWSNIHSKNNEEKNGIYFYFSTNTNSEKRLEYKRIVEEKGLIFGSPKPNREYLEDLAMNYKYAISPEGNGIDCHRVWECLYTNTIPICIRSVNTEYFASIYPIILVSSWNDLDIHNLPILKFSDEIKYRLSIDYYKNIIYDKMQNIKELPVSANIVTPKKSNLTWDKINRKV